MDAQQLVQCVLWFRGQFHLVGKKKEAAYNEAHKKVADLMRTVPTKRLLQLQAVSSMQQAQGALPNIPTEFAGYFAAKAATEAPQAADTQPWRRIPSLAELLSIWLVGPSPEFNTVSAAVHHFAKCTVNDARMCAKEIVAQEPSHRIAIFCAVAHVQRVLKHDAILPRGFQQVLKMREQVRKPKEKQQCPAQDICKVLVAVYLLKKTRPDLLAQAGAPGMQDAYGTSPQTGLRLMQFLVGREVTTTAIGLVRSPMWALIIDGAHKKAMRGAPDLI